MLLCLKLGQRLLTPSQPVIHFMTFIFLSRRACKKWWQDKSYSAIKLSTYWGCAVGRGTAPGPKGRTKPMWCLVGKAWIKSTITNISESNQGFGGAQLQKHNFQKVHGYHLLKIWPFWAVPKRTVIFCTLFQWIVRSSLLSLKIQAFCHTVPSFCTSSNSPSCQYATAWLVACLYCPEETLSRIQATIDVETQGEATRDRGGLGE